MGTTTRTLSVPRATCRSFKRAITWFAVTLRVSIARTV